MALLNPCMLPTEIIRRGLPPAPFPPGLGSQDTRVLFTTSQPCSRGPALLRGPHKTAVFEGQGSGVSVFTLFPLIWEGTFTVSE